MKKNHSEKIQEYPLCGMEKSTTPLDKKTTNLQPLIDETQLAYVKVLLSKEVGPFSVISFFWHFK